MFRLNLPLIIGAFLVSDLCAQTPTPTAAVSPSVSVRPSVTPGPKQLIDSLTPADLQEAVSLLKKNFADPEAINDTQLSRATVEGLISRLAPGVMLLADKASAEATPPAPLYSEILENHIGYLRLGTLNAANLAALDQKLTEFGPKKVDALIIDLRASSGSDLPASADFAKRFTTKGKTLFSVKKQGKQDRAFTSDREPSYHGLIVVLVDTETAGGGEALAGALRFYDKAMIIGSSTGARAFEYSDLPLPSGKVLRVATSEIVGPDGKSLYPDGIKPDLPVDMSLVDKRQIFLGSAQKGMAAFIYDAERPHLNEAALLAGTNPELETVEQRRGRAQIQQGPRDAMLQRALDLITSLEIYQKR